jgi:hypothetical protein
MLDKFWESIGSNLANRWLDYIFGPAFLFWVGGFGLYVWQTGWQQVLMEAQSLNQLQQGGWIVLSLSVLIFSSVLLQAIRFPILRLLEGYWIWPFSYLSTWIVALRKPSYQKKYAELRDLMKASEDKESFDTRQREELIRLENWAHWHPVKSKDLLPTELGNILRARERSPERKYGLDAVICWPRLWPLLHENMRTDLANARSSLDHLVELWFCGLLFLLWTFWTSWIALIIGSLWMIVTYVMARQAAMAYGDLLETAFDLQRLSLYDAIGWPRPTNSEEEKILGTQMTEFLWRGTLPESFTYEGKKG